MMKSALSSAFSIMPASLRPAHLSAHLPLPQGKGSSGGSPRQDLPRSPSPTYHFHAPPGSGASTTPSTPGGGLAAAAAEKALVEASAAAAVAANGAAAATSHAFARAKRPVPLRSVTASPTITTDNFPPYPPAPRSAGVLVTSPTTNTTAFSPSLRPVNSHNGGGGAPRSQPVSPAQSRFPLAAPLSASVGPSMTNPFSSSGGSGTPSASSPSSRRGSAGPQQQPPSPAAPRLTTSLSSQGGGAALASSNQYTGLGVAGLARRNTVDAGVSGGGTVSVNMGTAPPVRRPSAMGDGIQQRRPAQDPSNR